MKTEMTETIYNSKDTEGTIKARVRRVVFNASKFAEMENTAFWDDCPGNCVAVREGSEAPDTADIIPCRRIGKAVADWANALFKWCAENPDEPGVGETSLMEEGTGNWSEYAHRRVAVLITDLICHGGLRLEAFDRNGSKIMGIAFVSKSGEWESDDDPSDRNTLLLGGGRQVAVRPTTRRSRHK